MSNTFSEGTQRNLNAASSPKLSAEARKAVDAALKAMSVWRTEVVDGGERNTEQVIDKMAEAARASGWPEQIVDAARMQMQTISKMQVQAIDTMIDAWEGQIKTPLSSSEMVSRLKSLPNFGVVGSWPNADLSQMAQWNPFGLYMQLAEQWRKAWMDAAAFWSNAAKR